ncbi:hypothetical protein J4405_03615 [Candidatus Woesearchaeota archaeon]|nr:hypothetical protein [Candidatus Woesearchaeota archaeon]
MILKLMGLIDLLAGIGLVLLKYDMFQTVVLVLGLLVLIKAVMFFGSVISFIDIACFLVIILASFGIFNFISWIAAIWLFQKGFFSLF